jgi:hypothetical protein
MPRSTLTSVSVAKSVRTNLADRICGITMEESARFCLKVVSVFFARELLRTLGFDTNTPFDKIQD